MDATKAKELTKAAILNRKASTATEARKKIKTITRAIAQRCSLGKFSAECELARTTEDVAMATLQLLEDSGYQVRMNNFDNPYPKPGRAGSWRLNISWKGE